MSVSSATKNPQSPRYLEDFKVGDVVETGSLTLTREMIIGFAEQYDPQPMHLDEEAARHTVFKELVGSGWQTLLVTMKLLLEAPFLGGTPLIAAEFKEVRFLAPMRPGDVLSARAETMALHFSTSRPERGFMDLKVTTKNAADIALITQNLRLVLPTRASLKTEIPG